MHTAKLQSFRHALITPETLTSNGYLMTRCSMLLYKNLTSYHSWNYPLFTAQAIYLHLSASMVYAHPWIRNIKALWLYLRWSRLGIILQAPPTSLLRVLLWERACLKQPLKKHSCCADRFSIYEQVRSYVKLECCDVVLSLLSDLQCTSSCSCNSWWRW